MTKNLSQAMTRKDTDKSCDEEECAEAHHNNVIHDCKPVIRAAYRANLLCEEEPEVVLRRLSCGRSGGENKEEGEEESKRG